MKTTTIYGASDDLIELDGGIREELNPLDSERPDLLAFSDGTVLRIRYDDEGCWRIERIIEGSAPYRHKPATDPDDDYSDRAELDGVLWVVHGVQLVRGKK